MNDSERDSKTKENNQSKEKAYKQRHTKGTKSDLNYVQTINTLLPVSMVTIWVEY